ncbi:hypothetical protein NMY22_g11917 [Coprinellus aureogranulatus]|nr:hypothetical protein NMY22_g11917 [Coprinellus aureogranulatus]
MPTRVHNPTHTPEPHLHPLEKIHHDQDPQSKNWAHKEALHHALGSILSPVSPFVFGTRTPVHPAPLGLEYLHPHHASHYRDAHPHTPSKLGQTQSSAASQEGSPRTSNHGSPTMLTAPMTLPIPEQDEHMHRLPSPAVPVADTYVPPPSPGLGPIDDSDPRLKPLRPALTPLQLEGLNGKTVSLPNNLPKSGNGVDKRKRPPVVVIGTPKAKFFETLQGKSAWDALIHGSFS